MEFDVWREKKVKRSCSAAKEFDCWCTEAMAIFAVVISSVRHRSDILWDRLSMVPRRIWNKSLRRIFLKLQMGNYVRRGKSRSVDVGGHVVRTVSEHQQRRLLVRYIVVQRFVLVHGIGKFCSWVVVGGGVRKGRSRRRHTGEVMRLGGRG